MIVDCAAYEGGCRVADVGLDQLREWTERAGAFVWVGLFEPSEEELRTVQGQLGLHELAIEDAHQAHQRPKLDEYGDGLFLALRDWTRRSGGSCAARRTSSSARATSSRSATATRRPTRRSARAVRRPRTT